MELSKDLLRQIQHQRLMEQQILKEEYAAAIGTIKDDSITITNEFGKEVTLSGEQLSEMFLILLDMDIMAIDDMPNAGDGYASFNVVVWCDSYHNQETGELEKVEISEKVPDHHRWTSVKHTMFDWPEEFYSIPGVDPDDAFCIFTDTDNYWYIVLGMTYDYHEGWSDYDDETGPEGEGADITNCRLVDCQICMDSGSSVNVVSILTEEAKSKLVDFMYDYIEDRGFENLGS